MQALLMLASLVHGSGCRAWVRLFWIVLAFFASFPALAQRSPPQDPRLLSIIEEAKKERLEGSLRASAGILAYSPFRNPDVLTYQLPEHFRVRPQVVGGTEAAAGDWPFMVAIGAHGPSGFAPFCGGTAISERRVLTAAHCVDYIIAGLTQVAWGQVNLQQVTADRLSVVRDAFRHTSYRNINKDNYDYDVAILYVAPAMKVPFAAIETANPVNHKEPLVVMGWGATSATVANGGAPSLSPRLMHADVQVSEFSTCADAYRKLTRPQNMTDRMFCASAPGKDTCTGDSGGAIVRRASGGGWQQVGIVSFGESCALKDFPGVYTNISQFGGFIRGHLPLAKTAPGFKTQIVK